MLSSSGFGTWSCFTYVVDLRSTCNPVTSTFRRALPGTPSGCASNVNGGATMLPGTDLSGSQNLFFSAQFNLTRFSLDTQVCGRKGNKQWQQSLDGCRAQIEGYG